MAPKHIKIKAELVDSEVGDKKVKITLLEQTHFDDEFGSIEENHKIPGYSSISFRNKGLCIYSTNYGSFNFHGKGYENDKYGIYQWLEMSSNLKYVDKSPSTMVELKDWTLVKETIQLYNEWGSKQ